MKKLLLAAILGGLIGLAAAKIADSPSSQAAPEAKTAFDRVIATGTLRCAYAAYDPLVIIGADNHLTGIFHDLIEEGARRLNLKVEWTEEVGYGNINTGFMTGRYDAFCAGLWPAGSRAATTIFSRPLAWDPVSVWVRGDDTRFDGHMETLNDPAYKIADEEGDATVSMADAFFPKAGRATISQNQTVGEEIAEVTAGKAEAMFKDYMIADKFLQSTPGGIKDLSPGKPPLIYPMTVGYNQHEMALRDMFDVVFGDMERDGTIERTIKKYMGNKANLFYQQKTQFEPYCGDAMTKSSFSFGLYAVAAIAILIAPFQARAQGAAPELFDVKEVVVDYVHFDDPKASDTCSLTREQVASTLAQSLAGSSVPSMAALDAKPLSVGVARIQLIPQIYTHTDENLDCVSWVGLSAESKANVIVPPVGTPRSVTILYWRQHTKVATVQSLHVQAVNSVLQKMVAQFVQQYRVDQPPEIAK